MTAIGDKIRIGRKCEAAQNESDQDTEQGPEY